MRMIFRVIIFLFLFVLVIGLAVVFIQLHPKEKTKNGVGEVLYLTDFLENGTINEGRRKAAVKPLAGNIKSYSGFIRVDRKSNSNLFFWYFPAEIQAKTAPVALWIQGGPGVSSIYGLLLENGPYRVISDAMEDVRLRDYYWSKHLHVIYMDCSSGTGFSYTLNDSGYSTDAKSFAQNLYKALLQFFLIFPEIRSNDFYVAGESYGGIYVPVVAQLIHASNPSTLSKINLKGLLIGSGMIDPINQMVYSDFFYEIGIVDDNQRRVIDEFQRRIVDLIRSEKWLEANWALSDFITGEFGGTTLFTNLTGIKTISNYLLSSEPDIFYKVNNLFEKEWIRRRIHVGNTSFTSLGRNKARVKMDSEIMKTSSDALSQLLNNYKVLLYSGQLDIFITYAGIENSANNFTWCGSSLLKKVPREQWLVKGFLAGYIKTVSPTNCSGSLMLSLVRNAGHLVPRDQPMWTLDLIQRFTSNLTFD